MGSLFSILNVIQTALTAINAAAGTLQGVVDIVKPAIDEKRQLTDDERAQIAALANDKAEEVKAKLQAIVDAASQA